MEKEEREREKREGQPPSVTGVDADISGVPAPEKQVTEQPGRPPEPEAPEMPEHAGHPLPGTPSDAPGPRAPEAGVQALQETGLVEQPPETFTEPLLTPAAGPAALEVSPEHPAEHKEASPRQSIELVDIIAGVLAQPHKTFQALAEDPKPLWGFLTYMVISLVSWFVSLRGAAARFQVPVGTSVGSAIALTLLAGMTFLYGVGAVHITANLLGGSGHVRALIGAYGFATLPQVFLLPINLLWRPHFIIVLAFLAWQLALSTLAVKYAQRISTARGFASVILPGLLFGIAIISVIIGLVSLFMPYFQGIPGIFPPLR